jgi:hypothetical protein
VIFVIPSIMKKIIYRTQLHQWLIIAIGVTAPLNGCLSSIPEDAISPNVLIFLTDDLGYGDISSYSTEPPQFYNPPDLENWVDKRAPDGTTIIAPNEQATPAQYPGIKPMRMDGETFLFNLNKDIAEMNNVASKNPEIVNALKKEYQKFAASLKEE